ncbi:FAD-dependent oxidoreductase [Umezawaea endophytica]|uniref:Flavin-dependent monooxygenase n=1 Tax=Umezawaea endophytica TaxID=1654476 RepID=A0A9X2VEW6_9PSEU|nr:NAD(P)/FAD-dependent oxidoreductase [Umezawaea endophytica]MCS7475371.1 FAD-dependent monooxygenase [Umezawaea endophytica]
MTTSTPPRIAVIGAGPGGLTCARILQRAGIPVTVHEHDSAPDSRDQGGTLDMQRTTGQAALRAAGLLERFSAIARPEGQDMSTLDKHATVLAEHVAGPDEHDSPEIDRADLRALLLDSLDPGTVRFGETLDHVVPLGRGVHELRFRDGGTATTDLLIGADGAWSKVRSLVSPARPFYEGVMFIEIRFDDVDRKHPRIAELVGRGGMFAMQDEKALIAQRQARDRIRAYVAFRADQGWADGLDAATVRASLLAMFADWSPRLRALLTDCDDAFIPRPLHALPVPHVWNTRAGVTILGDAAHLMSPFSGLGANTAMLDGAELAQAVIGSADLFTALADYEAVMLPRAAANAADSHEALHSALTAGLPDLDHLADGDRATAASG